MSDQRNDMPDAAQTGDGPATSNAAKKATPAKKAIAKTQPAKKAAQPARMAAQPALSIDSDVRAAVLEVLTGTNAQFASSLPVDAVVLVVATRLEQRRQDLFNANGLYTGPDSFTSLVSGLAKDVRGSITLEYVMRRMRYLGVYTSERDGNKRKITFVGTSEARALAKQIDGTRGDLGAQTGVPARMAVTAPAPSTLKVGGSMCDAEELLVDNTVNDVFRLVGHSPRLAKWVAEQILSRLPLL